MQRYDGCGQRHDESIALLSHRGLCLVCLCECCHKLYTITKEHLHDNAAYASHVQAFQFMLERKDRPELQSDPAYVQKCMLLQADVLSRMGEAAREKGKNVSAPSFLEVKVSASNHHKQ